MPATAAESMSESEEEQTTQRVLEIVDSDNIDSNVFGGEKNNPTSENEVISIEFSPEKTGEMVTFRKINVVDSESSPNKRRNRVYRQSNKEDTASENEEVTDSKKDRRKRSSKRHNDEQRREKIESKRKVQHSTLNTPSEPRRKSEISTASLRRRYSYSRENEKENGYEEDETELQKLHKGIKQVRNFFDDSMCRKIEKKIDQIAEKATCGLYKQKTYDRAPLRNKYFFGEGYTYGKQMEHKGPGQERLHIKGEVDEIPKWIQKHVIQKVYDEKLVPEGFINSAVVNEYFPGGCIVSHVDPLHIFDRPIITISFNSKSYLSFGVKFTFNPIRTSDPILALPLDRGTLTMIRYMINLLTSYPLFSLLNF